MILAAADGLSVLPVPGGPAVPVPVAVARRVSQSQVIPTGHGAACSAAYPERAHTKAKGLLLVVVVTVRAVLMVLPLPLPLPTREVVRSVGGISLTCV